MKYAIAFLFISFSVLVNGQINQVHTSPTSLNTVCLDGQYKYQYTSADGNSIVLLNSDYSVYKTITVPWPSNHQWSSKSIFSVSVNYFTTDGSVCYVAWGVSGNYFSYVFKENGSILLSADTAIISQTNLISGNNLVAGVAVSHVGVNKSVDYYTVPGTGCTTCAWSCAPVTGMENPGPDNSGQLQVFPNPAINEVNLTYQLPQGLAQGDISIFTAAGQLVKTLHVTGPAGTIQDAAQPAGAYIYQLSTTTGTVLKKQFFIQ